MWKISRKSISLLWQYFFPYLIIIAVLILGMSLYMRSTFSDLHRRIIDADNRSSLALIRERNESELTQLQSTTNKLTFSEDVTPFVFSKNPDRALYLHRLMQVISASVDDLIQDMFLIFDIDDYVHSAKASTPFNKFVTEIMHYDITTPEELKQAFRSTPSFTILPKQEYRTWSGRQYLDSKEIVTVFLPIMYETGSRCGTVMYTILAKDYERLIGGTGMGSKNAYIMLDGKVIISRERFSIPNETVLDAINGLDGGTVTNLIYDNKEYILYYLTGVSMGFDYILLVPQSEMSLAITGTMRVFLILVIFLATVCLMATVYFVQRRTRPIQYLHQMIVNGRPNRNELIEIREGVQRMIEDNIRLHAKKESVELLEKADFARRFLGDGFESENAWMTAANDIKLNVDKQYYVVCILAKPTNSDYKLDPDKLNRTFDETVSGVSHTLGLKDKALLVVFADDVPVLLTWLENKFAGMRIVCAGLTMAVSSVHTSYTEGSRAYLEAERAFESRFVRGNARPIRFDETQEADEKNVTNTQQVIDRLHHALKMGDAERVRAALDEIKKIMGETNMSLFAFRCVYNDIMHIIANEVLSSSGVKNDIYDLFKLSECLSLDELDGMLHNVCARLISERDSRPAHDISPEIKRAMEIITQRFAEPDISVSSIAEELGMYESKLSLEFKQAYQLSPLECLMAHRMRQARKLLQMTDMSVKDIAIECGYYEISGFNRRFKAYTGQTPQQFRKSCKDDADC